ncbi:SigE family RNA polymerase sigma factor [Kribbella sp. NPDC050241]|uniref:SigE family RNA polymerase sigma factor n=1 Tax=Kribbella sp. NPDC050241 TaxID=3364115 RepID=UPI00378A14CD
MEFDEYFAARGQQLVRLGFVLSGDHHAAEDLAQHALMSAYRHWRRVRRMEDPHAYVRRILVNAHLSAARRRPSRETPMAIADSAFTEPDLAEAVAQHDVVWRALAGLKPRERTVLVLRYYEDLGYASIAALLGIQESTARATASRALAALKSSAELAMPKGTIDETDRRRT